MLIYRENFTLQTEISGYDLEAENGWTPDCGGKIDYDPDVICGSSRVYPDGDYICSVYCGKDQLLSTSVMSAGSVDAAKKACEAWMQEKAKIIRAAVEKALDEEDRPVKLEEN